MSKIKKVVLAGLLLAILIILSRFLSIKTPLLVISLSFIPIMISAIFLGPAYTALIAGLGDLIGAILFPFGAYFVGFTISQVVSGFVYGVFLYEKGDRSDFNVLLRIVISSVLVLGIVGICLTSFWLKIISGKAYIVVLSTRIVSQLIMIPIQIITIFLLRKFLKPFASKYLYE